MIGSVRVILRRVRVHVQVAAFSMSSSTSEFKGYTDDKGAYVNRQAATGLVTDPVPEHVKDWSTESKPTGVLFKKPESTEEWRRFRLTPSQIDQYWRDGYLSNIRVLSEEMCDKLLEDYKQFLDPDKKHPGHGLFYEFHSNQSGDPENVLMHALGHWRITERFHDLVFLPAISVPASQIIDPSRREFNIRLWHDQLFAKPPQHGGVVAWHQDYSYWTRTVPMRHLTVHVALDDQTPENGGLHFIPKSHRWHRDGMPLPITDDSFKDMESIHRVLTEDEKADFKPTPSNLKKGEASFHHPLMVHGSYQNRTNKPRRAAVVNYMGDGVKSDTDTLILGNTETVKKGLPMTGRFYPLVYETSFCEC